MTALIPFDGAELVESPTLRSRHLGKTDVLDRVGELAMLPGQALSTVKQVAEFYGVSADTIKSVVKDNRVELETNGYRVLTGEELRSLRDLSYVGSRAPSLAVFSRTAVLNVGMLLTASEPARLVRRYLLAVEATATVGHRAEALEMVRLQERMDYRHILAALKAGGADSDAYPLIQNMFYLALFGVTASQIKRSQKQLRGERKRDGSFRKNSVAKDHLTVEQLELLNFCVLATIAQVGARFPNGTTVGEMRELIDNSARLVKPRALPVGAA